MDANKSPGTGYAIFSCRFSIRFQLTKPYRSFTGNITKQANFHYEKTGIYPVKQGELK